jgi:hypothetical protein
MESFQIKPLENDSHLWSNESSPLDKPVPLEPKYSYQLEYRKKNREKYNQMQSKYYKEIKNDPERYAKRMLSVKNAVKKYQEKKKIENKQIKEELKKIKEAEKEAVKIWKQMNNIRCGRRKKGEAKIEIDHEWIEMKTKELLETN